MGYTSHAIKGASWTSALRVTTRLLTFVRIAVLARLLTPAQFGVFGIGSLFLALLEVFTETGVNVVLIQEDKDLKEYVNDAWIVSIARGVFIAVIIVLLAPFVSSFFHSPQAYSLILLMSMIPFIRGFINPSIVRYQKDLLFDKEFWLRFSIFMVDTFVAISFAFIFRDPTSFAFGMIAGAILEVILSFLFISPRPTFSFVPQKIKYILHRGKWVTVYGVFSFFAENGDNIVVGRILGSSPLGVYQVAYKFSTLPISEVTDVVSKVVFPVYSKISDDRIRLRNAFIKTSGIIIGGVLLLGGIIYFFSEKIIILFLGDSWISAIPVIKILAIYGVVRAIFGSVSALFLAIKKQEYVTIMIFVRFFVLLLTIVPLTTLYGLVGAAYAALISALLELPVILFLLKKVFRSTQKV